MRNQAAAVSGDSSRETAKRQCVPIENFPWWLAANVNKQTRKNSWEMESKKHTVECKVARAVGEEKGEKHTLWCDACIHRTDNRRRSSRPYVNLWHRACCRTLPDSDSAPMRWGLGFINTSSHAHKLARWLCDIFLWFLNITYIHLVCATFLLRGGNRTIFFIIIQSGKNDHSFTSFGVLQWWKWTKQIAYFSLLRLVLPSS